MNHIDRRGLLATCGGVSAAVAGCLNGILDASDGGSAGEGTLPDGTRWFPAPAAFERETYGAFSVDVSGFYEHRDALPAAFTEDLFDTSSMPGFDDPAQVDAIHYVGTQVTVTAGSIDRGAAVGHYTDQGFDRLGERRGFTLLEGFLTSIRSRRVIAVSDRALVAVTPASSEDDEPLHPLAETVVDVATGRAERYHQVNDRFRRLVETLPVGDTVSGAASPPGGSPDGILSNGTACALGSSTADLEAVVRFEQDAVDDVQSLVDRAASDGFFRGGDVETSVDDGTLRATASVPTDRVETLPVGLL